MTSTEAPTPTSPAKQSLIPSVLNDRVFQIGVAGLVVAVLMAAFSIYEVTGIPAHVLFVHGPIVLIPLTVLGAIACAVRPQWRRQYGPALVVFAVVTAALTVLAAGAGEALQEHGIGRDAEDHAEAGDNLKMLMLIFAAVIVGFIASARHDDRSSASDSSAAGSMLTTVLRIAVPLLAVLSLASTVYTGHLGSKAVWEDRTDKSVTGADRGTSGTYDDDRR